ncbi:MAG: CoA transferase [Ilumatobacteraceae bacterium]
MSSLQHPDRPNAPPESGTRPLTGIRVLDLTRVLSGPHATRTMADLGADVIKVEPPAGDTTRFTTPKINGLSAYFVQQNVGKRNLSVDMDKPEARELLLSLAEHCDVMIENFRPGVAARMGLGYEAVSARNPRIVYASISGYGQSGPWVSRRAYAPVVQAETGFTKAQGDARGGVYANDPFSHADVYTGLECVAAVLAALYQRERTGRGDRIDVTMAQTMLYVNEHFNNELWDGPVDPAWIRSFGTTQYPVLTAANGDTVVVSGHLAEKGVFQSFITVTGHPQLVDDPRFNTIPHRLTNYQQIVALVDEWAAAMPTAVDIEAALAPYGLATGKLRTVRELCESDWAEALDAVAAVSDRGTGTLRIPNPPWRFAGSDHGILGEPRYRGEDNRAVLSDLLGTDSATLDRLESDGVLSSRIPTTPG